MAFLHVVLLLLHVVTAAAWFGLALRLGGQARRVGSLGGGAAVALAEEGASAVRLMGVFLLLTFVFAMGVLGLGGGYPGQWQYHIASVLIVVLVIVQYAMIRPAWIGLVEAAASHSDTDRYRKRIAGSVGIGHLVWLALVVLMFWNRFAATV